LRLVFAGTPEFARVALERLHLGGHAIALVLTQPDRPGGRGLKLQASAVKQYALDHGMALAQPRSLRLDGKYPDDALAARAALEAAQADAMVVAAYGLILPQWVLDMMGATPGTASAGAHKLSAAAPGRPKQGEVPSGLEPAAPSLLEQAWTGDRGEASREPRPARPRDPHIVGERGGHISNHRGASCQRTRCCSWWRAFA